MEGGNGEADLHQLGVVEKFPHLHCELMVIIMMLQHLLVLGIEVEHC